MKKSQIDKVVEQLQEEIDARQKLITMLVGAQMKTTRKPRVQKAKLTREQLETATAQ